MGLGKTLQTIGLILSNPPEGHNYPYRRRGLGSRKVPRTTLIVCPLSVMANWMIQIKKFVNAGGRKRILDLTQYHGKYIVCCGFL